MLRPNDVLNRGLANLDVLIVPEGRLTAAISEAISLWVDNGVDLFFLDRQLIILWTIFPLR